MTKILLVENQITQFIKIRRHLTIAGYEVFPSEEPEDFRKFLNLVRIFLNKRYGGVEEGSRRADVFQKILHIINDEQNPELIIIDNILVGYHDAENGIFLAKELRRKNISEPIIFLSRTEQNALDTLSNLHQVSEPKIWVHKGYAGQEILDKDYITEHVINVIPKLLEKTQFEIYKQKIEVIKKLDFSDFNNQKRQLVPVLTEIIELGKFEETQISAIDNFLESQQSQQDIEEFIEFFCTQ